MATGGCLSQDGAFTCAMEKEDVSGNWKGGGTYLDASIVDISLQGGPTTV